MVSKIVFIQYTDKNKIGRETLVEGFFELIQEEQYYVKFKSGKNIVRVPWHNIQKIKEVDKND